MHIKQDKSPKGQPRLMHIILELLRFSAHSDILEPEWSAVFSLQPRLATVELARGAPRTFRRVRAIVKGDMVVADILEPAEADQSHRYVS
jgi:hypothetical protein